MKPIHIVFALLLVIAGITVYILLSAPPENAVGLAHPAYAGVQLGGSGAMRLQTVGQAPYYFQVAVILLAGTLLYMGVAPHRRDARLRVMLAAASGLALFVWYMLYRGYELYLQSGEVDIVLGFPVPTNWMVWGIWGSFAVFDLLYVFAFRRYFLPREDERAFEALVAESKAGRGEG